MWSHVSGFVFSIKNNDNNMLCSSEMGFLCSVLYKPLNLSNYMVMCVYCIAVYRKTISELQRNHVTCIMGSRNVTGSDMASCCACYCRGCERSDITKHVLIHDQPRHVCDICGKSFRHFKNKELHLKRSMRLCFSRDFVSYYVADILCCLRIFKLFPGFNYCSLLD